MAYDFPEVSFDWLGKLPAAYDEGRTRGLRRSLSDLDYKNPQDLERAASRLIAGGDLEGGLKLINMANQRRQVDVRESVERQFLQYIPGIRRALGIGEQTTPGSGGGALPPGLGGGTGNEVFPPPPGGAPGNIAPAPGGIPTGRPPALPPGADLGGSPQSPFQVAQAGGGPVPIPGGGSPGQPPPSQFGIPGPEVFGGGLVRPDMRVPTRPTTAMPTVPGSDPALQSQLDAIGAQMATMGPRASESQKRALTDRYKQIADKMSWPADVKEWHFEQLDNWARNEPTMGLSQWRQDKEINKSRFEAGQKRYVEYLDESRKANNLSAAVDRLDSIVNNPKFEPGPGSGAFNSAKAMVRNLKDLAIQNGVSVPDWLSKKIDTATESVALREAFAALSNTSIFEKLGTLGNQISEGDRNFIRDAFPNLWNTAAGNRLILDFYKELIAKNKELGRRVNEVARTKGSRLSVLDIEDAVSRYWDDPNNGILMRNGKLTPFGQRMQDENRRSEAERARLPAQAPQVPQEQPLLRDLEGQTVTDPEGNKYIIQNGKRVPIPKE